MFRPCILIFNSLSDGKHAKVVATLRDYLACEYRHKQKTDPAFASRKAPSFTKETMPGCCPVVPQQPNFTDCGVFVLQFVESFFKVKNCKKKKKIGDSNSILGGNFFLKIFLSQVSQEYLFEVLFLY